jgi:hypothetical protein
VAYQDVLDEFDLILFYEGVIANNLGALHWLLGRFRPQWAIFLDGSGRTLVYFAIIRFWFIVKIK